MKPIIDVADVSKKYSRHSNRHLRYGIYDLLAEIFGRNASVALRRDEFLAVDNVSFQLYPGDSLALIGRNGAGKSTLLKMLNGMIKPDAGRIAVTGRVQALINLGAGFNPVLSGLDNIYNSAAIYGFTRREAAALVDEIVAFSELEEAIESPLQTYSSGMKARLGFAVAVHLKPDILLIDEVLSVGDYGFRNKCLHKMQQLKKEGVTVVLVTHSKQDVLQVCKQGLWLHNGRIEFSGDANGTTSAYFRFMDELAGKKTEIENKNITELTSSQEKRPSSSSESTLYGPVYDASDHLENLNVSFECNDKETSSTIIHSKIRIAFEFTLKHPVLELAVNFPIYREDGLHMSTISSLNGNLLEQFHEGRVCCEIIIPNFDFNPGKYVFVMCIHDGKSYLYRNKVRNIAILGGEKHTWGIKDFNYEYNVVFPDSAEK